MKKVILMFSMMLIFLCSSCDLKQIFCLHELEIISTVAPTCTTTGLRTEKCTKCDYIEEGIIEKTPHPYVEGATVPADCENDGYTLQTCFVCGHTNKFNIVPALGHDLSIENEVQEATPTEDGIIEKHCSRCDYYETKYVSFKNYVDLSLIRFDYDDTKSYSCSSYEELSLCFNVAVLNFDQSVTLKTNFEYSSFDDLFDDLMDDCELDFDIYVNASRLGKEITFTFTYHCMPNKSTDNIAYTQYDSLNYQLEEEGRSNLFDDFKINNSEYSFNVSNSEQLSYCLGLGVKPICKSGSTAENLYNRMKAVLRQIITDDMTDYEKAKAIHDYLIMNVVYDNDLLLAAYNSSNISDYNGFYLEGVFIDGKAVCDGISKAYAALCNIEGIPCVRITGRSASNPSGPGHAWNKVYIDGDWYIVDVTSDGLIINNSFEILTYEYFLISESNYLLEYIPDNYQNIICSSSDYKVFENMEFTYKSVKYDYVIDSQDELNALVGYFSTNSNNNITIQFKVNFDYGTEIKDELQNAFNKAAVSISYSYRSSGSIITIIK